MSREPDEPAPCGEGLRGRLQELAQRFPGVPLLTLGQTVFWDEPIKVVVRRAIAEAGLTMPFVMAVHDTDYFARPHTTLATSQPYVVLGHNDGSTRALWSAAGEISCLFGAETVPGRQALRSAGVRMDLAAQAQSAPVSKFIDSQTEAWGWRGIVQSSGVETLTYEVPADTVLPPLLEMLEWAFGETTRSMCRCTGTEQARAIATKILGAVHDAAGMAAGGSLSDIYQRLFPILHDLVGSPLGPLCAAEVSHSLAEARFGVDTVDRPRFHIVDLFLNPSTRSACIDAYNHAVRNSEIYTLDRFGPGSIPFDLVTPRGGRGTLRILDDGVYIEGRRPEMIATGGAVGSVHELAAVVEKHFGGPVALVGKAVTWIAMLGAEFIFVFNEGASSYTRRTRQMLQEIRSHGISAPANPILRLRHEAWDALGETPSGFCLPDHYAAAFGCREISCRQFADTWREVLSEQEQLLLDLGRLTRPVDLMHFLSSRLGAAWEPRLKDYLRARDLVRAKNHGTVSAVRRSAEIREERYRAGMQIDALQRALGVNRRRRLADEEKETTLLEIDAVSAERRALETRIQDLRERRIALDRERAELAAHAGSARETAEYGLARQEARAIEAQAELERARLARDAYLVARSLEQNDRRPTAWWLPMVAPDGSWIRAICSTSSAYIEDL